ncbi:MAG: hypothetical protein HQL38_07435 [Alphaproteobacteria bacterium]|nr:hypothetical protein [Alphaproteobacteria bacterium]
MLESGWLAISPQSPLAPVEAKSPVRLSEIFEAGPWKHALFTTFTLSLSYFESEVLRPLVRGGCDDIWVIADAEGYRASLLERRSMRVGHEYRIIPAALPKGVFHSKCIYLAGRELGDLLLVGSGNLTFGGHGRNLEVFEAFRPADDAAVFGQFADFLDTLRGRSDIRFAQTEWVDQFIGYARTVAERGGDPPGSPVRLVHSLRSSAVNQLAGLLEPHGPCRQVTVMSPYHDQDGEAVARILASLKAPRAAVAVTTGEVSPFPFAAAASWSSPVAPVRPADQDTRFAHAKLYEFDLAGGRAIFTGSFNATRKALTTTDNVELGVLRLLGPEPGPLEWLTAAAPAFAPQERLPSGLGGLELVYAAFDRNRADQLNGKLITASPATGTWRGTLTQADGLSCRLEIPVDAAGIFTVRDASLEAFAQAPALQLTLELGERRARGWVHNDMLLGIGGRRRLTASALARLMRREGSDDDVQALLDYLSIFADQHIRLFNLPVTGGKTVSESDGAPVVSVSIDELAPSTAANGESALRGILQAGHGSENQFNAALAQLRRALLGHGTRGGHPGDGRPGPRVTEEYAESPSDEPHDQLTDHLAKFEEWIRAMIADPAASSEARDGLLTMMLEVGMAYRLHRLGDQDGAFAFMQSWLVDACHFGRAHLESMAALQQHVITAAATTLALTPGSETRLKVASDLHERWERFYRNPVDREHASRCLFPDTGIGFAAALAGDAASLDLPCELHQILATPSRRQQLADALDLATRGVEIPANWPALSTPLGRKLLERLTGPMPLNQVRAAPAGFVGCAFDWFRFAPQEAAAYRRERIGYCVQCQKFTLNTAP